MTDPSNAAMTSTPEQMTACPHCETTDHLYVSQAGSYVAGMPARPYQVRCHHLDCEDVRGPVTYGRQEAIAAWNRRSLSEGQKPVAWLDRRDFQIIANAGPDDRLSCRVSSHANPGDIAVFASPVSQPEQKPVAVKALIWREAPVPPSGECLAPSAVGLYCIPLGGHKCVLRFRDKKIIGEFDTLDEAKAAGQADYDQRIRAALAHPAPASPAGTDAKRIAELEAERAHWGKLERETQSALQEISGRFGVRGGEPRVSGIRRVLTELSDRAEAAESQLAALTDKSGNAELIERLTAPCEGEHHKFEEWAKSQNYDMVQHPLHYLLLTPGTAAARDGWKAALAYVRAALRSPAPDRMETWQPIDTTPDVDAIVEIRCIEPPQRWNAARFRKYHLPMDGSLIWEWRPIPPASLNKEEGNG